MSEPLENAITSMDFYRAVRLLDAAHPDLPRTGRAESPSQESVRFGQKPELVFARSPIESFEPATATSPPRLNVNFFGLFGPNGPLPLHLTEYARSRIRNHGDRTFSAFADIFHHRMIALFYRAWMVNQLASDLDRPGEQIFSRYIGSMFGAGTDDTAGSGPVPLNAKLYFTGRLACPSRNIDGIEDILGEFFGIPSEVEPFVGRWIPIPPDSQLHLNGAPPTCTLGQTAIMGSRVWDTQLSFRIHMGPMNFADYKRLLPRGDSFGRLRDWVLSYAGDELFWDVRLILRADEIPMLRLGDGGQQLGWTTWLHSNPPARDAGDLLATPQDTSQL
ncbi:MAG: type VI secretion system baseplate subunit TssG [Opitutaceae bacterium]|jgi:type VI secretion system protein ImpH|nr:type VI secretion system baseplate subunit TssG [Opitutaceae bacterium]